MSGCCCIGVCCQWAPSNPALFIVLNHDANSIQGPKAICNAAAKLNQDRRVRLRGRFARWQKTTEVAETLHYSNVQEDKTIAERSRECTITQWAEYHGMCYLFESCMKPWWGRKRERGEISERDRFGKNLFTSSSIFSIATYWMAVPCNQNVENKSSLLEVNFKLGTLSWIPEHHLHLLSIRTKEQLPLTTNQHLTSTPRQG